MSPAQGYKCVHSRVGCCHTCFLGIREVGTCSEVNLDGEVRVRATHAGRRAVAVLHLQKQPCVLLQTFSDVHSDKQLPPRSETERCWVEARTLGLSGGGCCAEDQAERSCEMMDRPWLEGTDRPGKEVQSKRNVHHWCLTTQLHPSHALDAVHPLQPRIHVHLQSHLTTAHLDGSGCVWKPCFSFFFSYSHYLFSLFIVHLISCFPGFIFSIISSFYKIVVKLLQQLHLPVVGSIKILGLGLSRPKSDSHCYWVRLRFHGLTDLPPGQQGRPPPHR